MYRFFISTPIFNGLSKEDEHHLLRVLRINIKERFEVVDSSLNINVYEVTSLSPFSYQKVDEYHEQSELNKNVTLMFALSKGDKQDVVIQKCTELGVSRIVLVPSERSVFKITKDNINNKLTRYKNIAKEAAMQCHRLIVPEIIILDKFTDLKGYTADINLVANENVSKKEKPAFEEIKNERVKDIAIYIGSEGGLSDEEIKILHDYGFKNVSLGNRILRCETAAIYSLSVISYLLER